MSDNEIHAKLDQRPDIVNTVPVSTEDALADVGKLKGKVVLVTGKLLPGVEVNHVAMTG